MHTPDLLGWVKRSNIKIVLIQLWELIVWVVPKMDLDAREIGYIFFAVNILSSSQRFRWAIHGPWALLLDDAFHVTLPLKWTCIYWANSETIHHGRALTSLFWVVLKTLCISFAYNHMLIHYGIMELSVLSISEHHLTYRKLIESFKLHPNLSSYVNLYISMC